MLLALNQKCLYSLIRTWFLLFPARLCMQSRFIMKDIVPRLPWHFAVGWQRSVNITAVTSHNVENMLSHQLGCLLNLFLRAPPRWQTRLGVLKRGEACLKKKPTGWGAWKNWKHFQLLWGENQDQILLSWLCRWVINPLGCILHSLLLNVLSFRGVRVDSCLVDLKSKRIAMAWRGIEFNLVAVTSKDPVPSPR